MAATPKNQVIPLECGRLTEEIDRLRVVTQGLRQRVSPALRPSLPQPDDKVPAQVEESVSPVASEIRTSRRAIASLNNELEEICDRVQL